MLPRKDSSMGVIAPGSESSVKHLHFGTFIPKDVVCSVLCKYMCHTIILCNLKKKQFSFGLDPETVDVCVCNSSYKTGQ